MLFTVKMQTKIDPDDETIPLAQYFKTINESIEIMIYYEICIHDSTFEFVCLSFFFSVEAMQNIDGPREKSVPRSSASLQEQVCATVHKRM